MKKLLIYIPSYNRFDFVVQQLTVLSESIERDSIGNISITVNDNASTDERYSTLKSLFPQKYITIKRNSVNIGLIGNLIHGFEQDGWDYIWLLSDDDVVKSEALRVISQEINEGKHDFFYLKCNIKGDDNVADGEILRSTEDYFDKFSTLSMMGLISANIYTARIKNYLSWMYLYGFTLFPFVAAFIKVAQNEKFSLKCIGGNLLEWRPNNRSYNDVYEMALSNVLFLAEVIDPKNRKRFVNKHIKDFGVTHFFPIAFKNSYVFKKALSQVGILGLLRSAFLFFCYQITRTVKFFFKFVKRQYSGAIID